MAAKSYEERIADLQKKQSQLKARENALKKKQAADEAKKRSHRLIELGAIIESVLGRSTTEEDKCKRQVLFPKKRHLFFPKCGKLFSRVCGILFSRIYVVLY